MTDQSMNHSPQEPEQMPESTAPDPVLTNDPAQTTPPGIEDRNTRAGERLENISDRMATGNETTGGDIDANLEQAKVVGEEAVGGTTPTPDQDVVDEIADSAGVAIPDKKPVRVRTMLERRDDQRWELDPQSSEDYQQHKP